MEVIHVVKEGGLMNTLEKFHVYNTMRSQNQINDKCATKPNILFGMLILNNSDRGHQLLKPPV
jgi:hypothetical protein